MTTEAAKREIFVDPMAGVYARLWRLPIANTVESAVRLVSAPFGKTGNAWNHRDGWHHGIDFAIGSGSDVVSPYVGPASVIWTGYDAGGGGLCVVLLSGNVRTTLCHLWKVRVKAGDTVSPGAIIALSGSSGPPGTSPHLHWQVKLVLNAAQAAINAINQRFIAVAKNGRAGNHGFQSTYGAWIAGAITYQEADSYLQSLELGGSPPPTLVNKVSDFLEAAAASLPDAPTVPWTPIAVIAVSGAVALAALATVAIIK